MANTGLIVCLGNSLIADDRAGYAVYELLRQQPLPPGVRIELLGVGGIRLLDELSGEAILVVVDAVRLDAPPGTLHVLDLERLPGTRGAPVTSHGIGLREAIGIGRQLYPERMPGVVVLVGIEGRCFDVLGADMTPEVAAAVPAAAAEVIRLVIRHREEIHRDPYL